MMSVRRLAHLVDLLPHDNTSLEDLYILASLIFDLEWRVLLNLRVVFKFDLLIFLLLMNLSLYFVSKVH